jgi:flagellar motor switch protein FliN
MANPDEMQHAPGAGADAQPGAQSASEAPRESAPPAVEAAREGAAPTVPHVAPTLDLLLDVELPLSVSFGRTYLAVREILKLSTGSIVELNCPANAYVDVIVNNCTIARGEVVVIEGNYGVRIDEIVSRRDRMLLQHKTGLNPHRPMSISA